MTLHDKHTNSRWRRVMACLLAILTLAGLFPFSVLAAGPTGGVGGLNPGSPGGQKPTTTDVAWTIDPGKSFLRFTLIEFPGGVVTDIGNASTWRAVGTPLNVVWTQGGQSNWTGDTCRSKMIWFDSNAMLFNSQGANAAQLMGGTISYYDASVGNNQRRVMTASEFAAESGITATQMDQIFHCASPSWSTAWLDGDYTSMWGTDPKPVTPNNLYKVYKPNNAFLYLLGRLSEAGGAGTGWSQQDAISHWCEYVHDAAGNLRTKYRIIVEPGVVFQDPDGLYRANTLREAMAYSLYNNEAMSKYNLIWDQNATILNMAQWMRQAKNNQFLEYPLDASGNPTGEELHSVNGFTEADSFVDSITSAPKIRSTIFTERRSYGLHILSPFNFEHKPPAPSNPYLEVTKQASGSIPAGTSFGFTVTYTAGTASKFSATKNGVACTDEVTATGSGLKFSLKAGETIHIDFEADESFRFEVTEDDPSQLINIAGSGGVADMTSKKFVSSGGAARVVFTNGTTTVEQKPVYLKLKKIAAADKRPLSGAEFTVYADSSCSGTPLAVMTTGADGTASTSIPSILEDGKSVTLYVKETRAPSGCTLLASPLSVTCKAPENSTEAGAAQVGPAAGIENAGIPEPGKALVLKRDAQTNTGVGPATFKFSSVTNGDYEFDTDEAGELESVQWWDPTEESGKYIKPGEYAVTELVPPPGYEGTTEVQQIKLELDDNGYPVPAGPLVFKNQAKPGLKIVKYDRQSHKPMTGVTFEIFKDGTSIGKEETDSSGTILLSGIEPGTYRAVEVDTGDDGHILDTGCQEVELTAGDGVKELVFFNDSKPGLKLVKVDSSDLSKTIAGAKFSIRAIDGSYGPQEFTTDASGEIDLSKLPAGSYEVTELECPGYIIDSAQRLFHLKANDTAQFVFTNTKKPGLRLVKASADGSPLPGVTFRIAKIEDGTHYLDRVTDGNGEINLSDLEPGVYSVVETAVPLDHILDKTEHHVELTAGKIAEIRLTNDKKPALRLIKTSSDGSNLAGVHFRIAKIGDWTHYLDRVTDQNGEINIEGLDPGVYSVKETATTADHILDLKEYHVELFPNKTSTITIENQKRPTLVISKTDKDTGKPVPGVTFTLRGADGPTITTKPTSADGKIVIENLLPGVYTITEQSVPENYILDTTPQTVTLFANRETQVEFQNYQRPTLKITKVDINGKHLTGAIFEVKTKAGVKIGDFPVDANGEITVPQKHLTEGYYLITEIQAPKGYILDKTPHEVYLRPGKTTEVSIENEKKPGLTIYKVDSVVGDGVKGAKFELWVSKDKTEHGTYQKLNDTFYYTDENGMIELPELDTGWYKIKEVEPPAGYMLKEPSEQILYIEHDKGSSITFENTPKSALVIRKIDSDTGAPLANAWFRVRYLGGTSGSGGTIIGEYQTSANGNIIVTGLAAGTYVVEEISAPHGYVMDTAPQTAYISGKEQDCITLTFTNSKFGSLLIKKVDSVTKEPLSDVQFFVTTSDGHVVGNSNGYFVTDSAGTILVSDIKPGTTLVVKETRTIPGYILDDTPQTVKIESNETKTLEFRNQPTGSLLVRKVCATNPSVVLQNAEFKIAYADGSLIGDSNGIFRTNESGEIRVEGLAPGKSVVVTETRAPAGFLIDTAPQTAVIQSGKTVTLTFKDQPKGKLIVQKRDSQTGAVLPGAEFRITTAAGCEVGLDGVIGSSTLTSNGIFTTDSQGEIRISNLAPGAYVLSEIKAPAGYVIDTPSTNVVIGQGGDTQTIVVKNTKKGGLIVEKYDSVTKQALPGAQFKITTASGELVADNEGLTSSNGLYTTDVNGQIMLSKLLPGTYVVAEDKAPDNYRKDPTPQTVVVNAGDTQTVRFYDEPLCSLTILKRDTVTKKPLKGAEFTVTDSSGHVIGPSAGKYVTGTDGTVTVTGMQPNSTVVVRESKAPKGYILDETPKHIVVRSGEANSITFDNEPGTTLIIHKFIEGTENEPLSGVCFRVVDGSGAAVGPDDGTYYTDKAGEIVLDGIEPGTTVKVREIKTVDGFVLDGTPQDILIKGGEVQQLTFWNKRAGTLLIEKLDSVTKAPLAGAQFKVLYADGRVVDTEGGKLSSNGIYLTDKNGQIKITGLVGTVVVTEEKAPDGYVMDVNAKSQTVVVNPMDTQALTFVNEPLCSLTITKLDSVTGKPIPNTSFVVKDGDGNVLARCTTGKDGTATVTGLTPGSTVVVMETRVPDGYVLNTTPQTIIVRNGSNTVSSGNTSGNSGTGQDGSDLTFENDPKQTLTIRKYIEGTKNEPLAGVTFKLVDGSGTPVGPSDGTFVTDSNGEIVVEGLEPSTTITAQEVKTVDGFVLDGTPKSVKIKAGQGAPELTFWNKRAGTLVIQKKDSVTGALISGAQFQLTYAGGGYVDNDNGHLSSNGLYTTDDKGEIRISGIVGTVVVKEVKAAPGYVVDQATQVQTVTVNPMDTQTLTFLNEPLCSLTITKLDSTTGKPIPNTSFVVKDGDGNVLAHCTTGKEGTATVTGLIPGNTVVVTETHVPDGYVLNTTPQTIIVRNGSNTVSSGGTSGGSGNDLTFENTPKTKLIIEKYITGTTTPLKGVTFLVTDSGGELLGNENGEFTTDENGRIVIEGLEPGATVTAKEIRTLEGYILDSTPKSIKIKVGAAQTLKFYNQKKGCIVIRKLDSVTKKPLAGVEFQLTYADGSYVDADNGHLSSKGLFTTNKNGEIRVSGVTGTIIVTETRTIDGYTIDEATRTQSVKVNAQDTQTLTFYNDPIGGLELIKVSEADKTMRIPDTTFEIRRASDGGLVKTVTTGKNGRVYVDLDAGSYYAVEIEAAKGYKLDSTPHYFTVKNGETCTLTVKNKPISGILIHKTDGVTGKGLYGVSFLLYDGNNTPLGQYTSDDQGYVYIENLTVPGRYFLRELDNPGYVPDTQMKTVYVKAGETTLVNWKNIPITAQIQITKKSADYNSINGLPAGTLLEGTVFEIRDKAGNLVDTIKSDKNGVAASKPLPLGRYTIREIKAPANYQLNSQELTAYLEHAGQIVRFEMADKSITTGVAIQKTGPKEAMAGQPVNYTFSSIGNTSSVTLTSFYWRDILPAEVRLNTIVTGTYNFPGTYKITYRVNGGEYRTLADNLSTSKNYTLAASPAALGLAANQRITEVMFVFGQVPAGFAQVEKPQIKCIALANIAAASFVNVADVGGVYGGKWIQAVTRWVTIVYRKPIPLPKTGY